MDYKKIYVYLKNTKDKVYYYPRTLPRRRGSLTFWLMALTSIIFFLVPIFITNDNFLTCFRFYLLCILIIFLRIYIHRFLLYFEESNHLISRYDGDRKKLLKELISLPTHGVVLFVSTIFLLILIDESLKPDDFIWLFVPYGLSSQILATLLNLDSTKLHLSLWIDRQTGLDYGSSMAYSYYYGYLRLILTKQGEEDRNLRQVMENFENKEHIEFTMYKLFILIPKSMKCLDNLVEGSRDRMEAAKSLLEKVISRAGVQKRVYKNSVYKIHDTQPITYIVAEYASPLKTFKEVVEGTGHHSNIYRELQNDIVHQFYITLNNILTENDLQDSCELIYYDDKDDKGAPIDIGKLLLRRISQMKKAAEPAEPHED